MAIDRDGFLVKLATQLVIVPELPRLPDESIDFGSIARTLGTDVGALRKLSATELDGRWHGHHVFKWAKAFLAQVTMETTAEMQGHGGRAA